MAVILHRRPRHAIVECWRILLNHRNYRFEERKIGLRVDADAFEVTLRLPIEGQAADLLIRRDRIADLGANDATSRSYANIGRFLATRSSRVGVRLARPGPSYVMKHGEAGR